MAGDGLCDVGGAIIEEASSSFSSKGRRSRSGRGAFLAPGCITLRRRGGCQERCEGASSGGGAASEDQDQGRRQRQSRLRASSREERCRERIARVKDEMPPSVQGKTGKAARDEKSRTESADTVGEGPSYNEPGTRQDRGQGLYGSGIWESGRETFLAVFSGQLARYLLVPTVPVTEVPSRAADVTVWRLAEIPASPPVTRKSCAGQGGPLQQGRSLTRLLKRGTK